MGVAALVAPLSLTSASAVGTDPCLGTWTPEVRSATVNQGLGSYATLVRGKTTLVRLFLTAPLCAGTQPVELLAARVRAVEGGVVVADRGTTPVALGPQFPVLPAFAAGASDDGPGNPVVQLPALGQGTSTASTRVRFERQLTYRYTPVAGAPPSTVTTPWTDVAQADLAPPSHALRVLVVPMGDATASRAQQFPLATNGGTPVEGQYADTVVQTALQATARTMPVPDGVADLTATSGGLRYRLLTGAMVDLGPAGLALQAAGEKTCMTGTRFSQVTAGQSAMGLLKDHLASWNTANPTAQADRVLGVVWGGVSKGTRDGCPEGLAVVDGTVGYVRLLASNTVVASGAPTPNRSMSGALTTMELAHTLGAVPPADTDRTSDAFHSKNTSADPLGTRRTYDTSTARWIPPVAFSAMRYSGKSGGYTDPSLPPSAWHDGTVLLEAEDQAFAQCELSAPGSSTTCPAGATRSSVGLAAAGAALVLSGTTDGSRLGTELSSSYDEAVSPTSPQEESGYQLALRGADGEIVPEGVVGLPARTTPSVHDHDHDSGGLPTPDLTRVSIYAAVPLPEEAVALEVWKGEPGQSCTDDPRCLYARARGTAPVVSASGAPPVLSGLAQVEPVESALSDPAVAPDGRTVAHVADGRLSVRTRDPMTGALGPLSSGEAAREPSWSPDGDRLAYATPAGSIRVVPVERGGDGVLLGAPATLYDHLLQTPPLPRTSTSAASPSWSPDGSELAVAIDGGVWAVSAGTASNRVVCDLHGLVPTRSCRPVLPRADAAEPDWGDVPTPSGSGLIAYRRGDDVHTVDPGQPGDQGRLRLASAGEPAWGAGLLAVRTPGGIGLTDAAAVTGRLDDPAVTVLGQEGDRAPALARDVLVLGLGRPVDDGAGKPDVLLGTLGRSGDVEFSATTAGDPALLRGDLFLGCSSGQDPVAVALRPVATTAPTADAPGTATFRARFDDAQACPGGTLSARSGNGWDVSPLTPVRTFPTVPAAPSPSPAITAPAKGTTYRSYEAVVATGSLIGATGATNPDGVTASWSVRGPGDTADRAAGSGYRAQLDPPPGGLAVGPWTITLTVTGPSGSSRSATSSFVVVPDPVNHRVLDVRFEPQTLYVPSQGSDISLRVVPRGQDLRAVDPRTVRIVSVGELPSDLRLLPKSGAWAPSGLADGSWIGKFDRQAVVKAIAATGHVGGYVPVVVAGGSGQHAFAGSDPASPQTRPAG